MRCIRPLMFGALALACSETPAPQLEAVSPPVVSNVSPAFVSLLGEGLTAVPTIDLDESDPPAIDDLFLVDIGDTRLDASLIEAGQIDVLLDEGFPAGTYDVSLITPTGARSTLSQALTVTDQNVRGCLDNSDCIDPCHSGGECVDNVCEGVADNALCTMGTPVLIAELSDVGANDRAPTVTADLLELYFQSDRGGADNDIFVSSRASPSDPWGDPIRDDELSTNNRDDGAPEISADGLTIYLASDRDMNNQVDIYVSTRMDRAMPWSPPVRVAELSSDDRDEHATPDSTNRRMVTRRGPLFDGDLFLTSRIAVADPWDEPVPIVEINTSGSDSSGFLEGDGLIMVLAGDRLTGVGANDLWVTSRTNLSQRFAVPELLDSVSSPGEDLDPWISADGSYAVFASDRDGNFNLYEAR